MPIQMISKQNELPVDHYGVRLNWGSIICGSFITLAVGLFFVLLGNALGLSAVNIVNLDASVAVKTWSWTYTLITLAGSFYVGGYCTTRLGGISSNIPGALHGLTSWALSGVAIVAFGMTQSPIFKDIIGGNGTSGANWLVLFIALFGGLLSMTGGMNGCVSKEVSIEREKPVRAA